MLNHLLLIASILFLSTPVVAQEQWQTRPGFQFSRLAGELIGPSSIALLSKPDEGPDAVIYFVTELRGKIKAVTRSGEVLTIGEAEDMFIPDEELPTVAAELGQSGLCLDNHDRYLFTTFVAQNGKRMVNRIARWEKSANGWRKLKISKTLFEPLVHDRTAPSHFIGHCFFDAKNNLWVGLGDGQQHEKSHNLGYSNGKILRLTTDLTGVEGNPFFDGKKPSAIGSMIFASGFRNPFAVTLDDQNRVLIADNGVGVDRLVQADPGLDFPWDGTDDSFTYRALKVWPKAIGPSQMVYLGKDSVLPSLQHHLLIASSFAGKILAIPMNERGEVTGPDEVIVELVNSELPYRPTITSLVAGKDSIYVALLNSENPGSQKTGLLPSAIWQLKEGGAKTQNHPVATLNIEDRACRGCHTIGGQGRSIGPALDNIGDRLTVKLDDANYFEKLKQQPTEDFTIDEKELLNKVLTEKSTEAWIALKILRPTFELSASGMPAQAKTLAEAETIAKDLLSKTVIKRKDRDEVSLVGKAQYYYNGLPWLRSLLFFILGAASIVILSRVRTSMTKRGHDTSE